MKIHEGFFMQKNMETALITSIQKAKNVSEGLKLLKQFVEGKIVFSTSFGIEDQVITHEIFTNQLNEIEVFTLDTGRLFQETYDVWDKTLLKYQQPIKAFYPEAEGLSSYITQNGINAFYESQDLRKQCCHLRKVVPLKKALHGAKIWITGLRAEQSDNRGSLEILQWDEGFGLYKYNPLLHWKTEEVVSFLQKNNVPYNKLHDKGFVSIGCAPCTRPIKDGEDFRAGRWWWEDQSKKECGLHR